MLDSGRQQSHSSLTKLCCALLPRVQNKVLHSMPTRGHIHVEGGPKEPDVWSTLCLCSIACEQPALWLEDILQDGGDEMLGSWPSL